MYYKMIRTICLGLMSQLLLAEGLLAAQDSLSLPDIAGLYQTTVIESAEETITFSDQWRLWRNEGTVNVQKEQLKTQEQWERVTSGEIYYLWSSHPNEFSVAHVSTDLSAPGVSFDWNARAMIVNPELLELLEKGADSEMLGHRAENYVGIVDGVEISLVWLADIQILAKVVQVAEDQQTSLELLEVYPFTEAPWQPVNTGRYRELDYVDLADHESDPLVSRYMEMRGGHGEEH